MITRIEVDGFKSLRDFAVDLEPLTAIVGANGAGKSNLLDALQLLSRLAQGDVIEALKGGRGAIRDQFSRSRDGATDRIRLSIELLLGVNEDARRDGAEQGQTRVRHEIEIERAPQSSGLEEITVSRERVTMLEQSADGWLARHPALVPLARYEEQGNLFYAMEPNDSPFEAAQRTIQVSFWRENVGQSVQVGRHRSMLALSIPMFGGMLTAIAEELRAVRVAHFEPSKLRLPSERAAGAALAADGSNLPTALAALAPEARAQIRADLAELIPGFRTFEVVPADEELRLEVELTDGARVPARVLSDGTLRLIALLTLLRGSLPGALIAVEEPENGIYPGRLRALVEKLVDATTPRGDVLPPQVLLTSHSPAILAALHGRPESLVFADLIRHGDDLRSTRMRRVRAEDSDSQARDPSTVSRREIERILDSARPEDEA